MRHQGSSSEWVVRAAEGGTVWLQGALLQRAVQPPVPLAGATCVHAVPGLAKGRWAKS